MADVLCVTETGHDPAVHGARLEDRFYNNDSFKVCAPLPISKTQLLQST